jgi:hypothetical protein
MVTLSDRWLVDVGFGDSFLESGSYRSFCRGNCQSQVECSIRSLPLAVL